MLETLEDDYPEFTVDKTWVIVLKKSTPINVLFVDLVKQKATAVLFDILLRKEISRATMSIPDAIDYSIKINKTVSWYPWRVLGDPGWHFNKATTSAYQRLKAQTCANHTQQTATSFLKER